jgi:hypothetical protein
LYPSTILSRSVRLNKIVFWKYSSKLRKILQFSWMSWNIFTVYCEYRGIINYLGFCSRLTAWSVPVTICRNAFFSDWPSLGRGRTFLYYFKGLWFHMFWKPLTHAMTW